MKKIPNLTKERVIFWAVLGGILLVFLIYSASNIPRAKKSSDTKVPPSMLKKYESETLDFQLEGERFGNPSEDYSIIIPGEVVSCRNNSIISEEGEVLYVVFQNDSPDNCIVGFNSLAQYGNNDDPKLNWTEQKKDVGYVGEKKCNYSFGEYSIAYTFKKESGYYGYYSVELDSYYLYVMAVADDNSSMNESVDILRKMVASIEPIVADDKDSKEEHNADSAEKVVRDMTVFYEGENETAYFVISYLENGETPEITLITPDRKSVDADETLSNSTRSVFVIENAKKGEYAFHIETGKEHFITGIERGVYTKQSFEAMFGE